MRAEFEQYRAMKMRVKNLRAKLEDMQCLTDTVMGSSAEYPYTQHPMTVCGRNATEEQKVQREIVQLLSRIARVERCVEAVEDQEWKLILELKYTEGARCTWDDVAGMLYMDVSGDALRKRADKFFAGLSGFS